MRASHRWTGCRQRGAVLQLIAKSIGAAGLIESRARPYAAGDRLIEQPAVQHDVHRAVRRLDLNGPKNVVPVSRDLFLDDTQVCGAIARNQTLGVIGARGLAEKAYDLNDLVGREFKCRPHGAAGIETGTGYT